jgi:hypothetical protein
MAEERDIYADLVSYSPDEPMNEIGSVKVYDGSSFYITTRLSDIYGSYLTEVDDPDTGKPTLSLVIPIRKSGLTLTPKRNVLAVYKAQMAQVPSKKFSHLLTRVIDITTLEEMHNLGFKRCFEGHMRPADTPKQKNFRKK